MMSWGGTTRCCGIYLWRSQMRMDQNFFEEILERVTPKIRRKSNNFCPSMRPVLLLSTALRSLLISFITNLKHIYALYCMLDLLLYVCLKPVCHLQVQGWHTICIFRYFATENAYTGLQYDFPVAPNTFGLVVRQVAKALIDIYPEAISSPGTPQG